VRSNTSIVAQPWRFYPRATPPSRRGCDTQPLAHGGRNLGAGADNVAMDTDLSFDMATPDPVAALEQAVDAETARRGHGGTPRRLFRL
jgi:hypothetical protein